MGAHYTKNVVRNPQNSIANYLGSYIIRLKDSGFTVGVSGRRVRGLGARVKVEDFVSLEALFVVVGFRVYLNPQ